MSSDSLPQGEGELTARIKRYKRTIGGRITRKPIRDDRDVLLLPPRKGYVRQIIKDVGNRIFQVMQSGWEPVEESVDINEAGNVKKMGSIATRIIGTQKDNSPMVGVVMEMKQETWEEVQRQKAGLAIEQEDALATKHLEETSKAGGEEDPGVSDANAFSGGIEIKRK